MIIYFTGTGNSEYIAKAIADRLEDEVVCSNIYIKENKTGVFSSEKPFVFVFPVYLSISPAIFREFVKSCSFEGNPNAYFVPTCASADGSVPNASDELCRETGFLNYMGCCKVCMPQNYIIMFKPTPQQRKEELYKDALTLVDGICDTIKAGEKLLEEPCSNFEYVCTKLVEKWYNSSFTKTKRFNVSDECIGCGACERNCPTNSVKMEKGRPVWVNKVCIHCMACISKCPKKAIEFGKITKGKERHVCSQ